MLCSRSKNYGEGHYMVNLMLISVRVHECVFTVLYEKLSNSLKGKSKCLKLS